MMKNKYTFLYAGVLFLLLSLLGGAYAAPSQDVNRIAAVVNSEVITQADLNRQVNLVRTRLTRSHTHLPSQHVLIQQVLEQMINRELQLQEAKRVGLKVTDKQVNAALSHIAEQNHLTISQLYASSEKDGYTKEEFQQEISDEILMQMVQEAEVGSHISVSNQEVEDFLNIAKGSHSAMMEYNLQDILIALPDTPTPEQIAAAKKRAQHVITELKKGVSFKTLALEKSAGQQALKGGDLGWRTLVELPTPFVSTVEKMKAGEVAGPIRTPNGFHVIKLLKTNFKGTGSENKAEEKKQIEQMIFERQFNQALVNWIAQLRSQAYIKTFPHGE